jgi:hypothetical protein
MLTSVCLMYEEHVAVFVPGWHAGHRVDYFINSFFHVRVRHLLVTNEVSCWVRGLRYALCVAAACGAQ